MPTAASGTGPIGYLQKEHMDETPTETIRPVRRPVSRGRPYSTPPPRMELNMTRSRLSCALALLCGVGVVHAFNHPEIEWKSVSTANFVINYYDKTEPAVYATWKIAEESFEVVSALFDGRLVCGTFETSQNGRFVLLAADGTYIDEMPAGFGLTDIGWPAR